MDTPPLRYGSASGRRPADASAVPDPRSEVSGSLVGSLRVALSVAPAAEQVQGQQEDVEEVEEDPGRDRHGGIGRAAAQAG
jgi:hypothetical protein